MLDEKSDWRKKEEATMEMFEYYEKSSYVFVYGGVLLGSSCASYVGNLSFIQNVFSIILASMFATGMLWVNHRFFARFDKRAVRIQELQEKLIEAEEKPEEVEEG